MVSINLCISSSMPVTVEGKAARETQARKQDWGQSFYPILCQGTSSGEFSSVWITGWEYVWNRKALTSKCLSNPYPHCSVPFFQDCPSKSPYTAEKTLIEVHFHCTVAQLWCLFLFLSTYLAITPSISLGFHLTQRLSKDAALYSCCWKWKPQHKRNKDCISSHSRYFMFWFFKDRISTKKKSNLWTL